MALTEEDRQYILNEFLRNVSGISNKEYQKRIWIIGEGPEVDSYDDAVCDFFLECDSILENHKDFGITENQCQVLKKFRDKFEEFSDENDWPPEFIDTPEWNEITKMAKDVLKAFNYQKSD